MPQTGLAAVAVVQSASPPMPCAKFCVDGVLRSSDSTSNCWADVEVPGVMPPARGRWRRPSARPGWPRGPPFR